MRIAAHPSLLFERFLPVPGNTFFPLLLKSLYVGPEQGDSVDTLWPHIRKPPSLYHLMYPLAAHT